MGAGRVWRLFQPQPAEDRPEALGTCSQQTASGLRAGISAAKQTPKQSQPRSECAEDVQAARSVPGFSSSFRETDPKAFL